MQVYLTSIIIPTKVQNDNIRKKKRSYKMKPINYTLVDGEVWKRRDVGNLVRTIYIFPSYSQRDLPLEIIYTT